MNLLARHEFLLPAAVAAGVLLAAQAVSASTSFHSRMDMAIDLTGDWEPTQLYEVETLNNNYRDPDASFTLNDAGPGFASVSQLGYRERLLIEPWPFPDIDPIYTTELVPIGRSYATGTHVEVNADATSFDDIEGFARIKHLTPTTDQIIDISFNHHLRSGGGIFWVYLRMVNEATGGPNLLPLEVVSFSQFVRMDSPLIDTVVVPVDVQAGNSYTFEITYDIYPTFVPEPAHLMLLAGGALVMRRRRGAR